MAKYNKGNIGVITWHNYPNFGSALQAYALHTYINNLGKNAILINYVPNSLPKYWKLRLFLSFFDFIIPKSLSRKLHYRFLAFEHKYFKETSLITSKPGLKDVVNKFDTFICGSDQIWAPNVFDETYMLSFVPDGKKKYSYAASIGLSVIPKSLREKYKFLLSRFDGIAVREQQGADLLKQIFDIKAKVVLDPTFLIDANSWCSISKKPNIKEKYILCYFLGKTEKHRKIVEIISNQTGYKVICLSRFPIDFRPTFTTETDAGPREFLGLVANASLVVTDSFHGLCFSINLNRDFYIVNRFTNNDPINQNSRIQNILGKMDLQDRLINEAPSKITSIDYIPVNERLQKERDYSVEYLRSIIE